jgi:hypothetical protein
MRSRAAPHRDVPPTVDVAITIALVGTVTFFIVAIEYCAGQR